VIVSETCSPQQREYLQQHGAEVVAVAVDETARVDFAAALKTLAQKGIMHVLLEGGSRLLGSAFEHNLIDHVAAFIAPKIVGGAEAPSPIGGAGLAVMQDARRLQNVSTQIIDGDLLIEGDITAPAEQTSIENEILYAKTHSSAL
jgi:diaminohydroxyphosphoribosylaminopyrimidine deaminase/5-amino-6-(5-phosphoribosylamino)uracil reductase